MPITSTIESIRVPLSRVSGSGERHTRWMDSHSLYRDRSEAHSHAFSGARGTSTETESLAMGQGCLGGCGSIGGCGGGIRLLVFLFT